MIACVHYSQATEKNISSYANFLLGTKKKGGVDLNFIFYILGYKDLDLTPV